MKYTKHWSCLKCFDAVGSVAGKGIRPVKRLSDGMLAWLSVWSEVQTYIWPSWCHCHSLSLASVKSRLVFPFWYRLTRVVPDKGPLNVCVCVCVLAEVWYALIFYWHSREYLSWYARLLNGPLSRTARVSWYQKKHAPSHTHEEEEERFTHTTRSIVWVLIL